MPDPSFDRAEGDYIKQVPPHIDMGGMDPFDKVQLAYVIAVCKRSRTLSEAGRKLFAQLRLQKRKSNDADRLKKYLAKFNLDWERMQG